jgi:predicted branched-subunit amino acid permease
MDIVSSPQISRSTRAAGRLTSLAGWSLVLLAVLHTAVFVPLAPWSDWFDGSLHGLDGDPDSLAVFWGLPGGFVIPALLLGLLVIRMGRQRQRVGLIFALVLAAWVTFCLWLVGPSGFVLIYSTAGLLAAAAIIDRRKAGRSAEAVGADAARSAGTRA